MAFSIGASITGRQYSAAWTPPKLGAKLKKLQGAAELSSAMLQEVLGKRRLCTAQET